MTSVTIIDRGPGATSIKVGDVEVKGIRSYAIQREAGKLVDVTLTIACDALSVVYEQAHFVDPSDAAQRGRGR